MAASRIRTLHTSGTRDLGHRPKGQVRSPPVRIPFAVPPPASKPFDVAGFGLNSIDLVAVVAEYPTSNSKQRIQRFARLPGGHIATTVAACARLGWRGSSVE